MILRSEGLGHAYHSGLGMETVLREVSFETGSGQFLSILGPSGCGKTTLLRILAGSLAPQYGCVTRLASPDDGAGGPLLIRQENSLFPWMKALDNACFGLRMQNVPKPERERVTLDLFDRFGLTGWQHAYPQQLSAGMKQRVALIRGFVSNPAVLLMDEPFAALDAQTRGALQQELQALCARWVHVGVVFVTHDVDEALLLSDRILVFSQRPGSIVDDVRVPLPRPRSNALTLEPAFLRLKARLLRSLGVDLDGRPHA